MDTNTEAIIRLSWARRLGLADDALTEPGRRELAESNGAIHFISFFGVSVMSGPQWALERAESLSDDELTTHAGLLSITAGHSGRESGTSVLAYADVDTAVVRVADDDPLVSRDHADARRLETLCPPDDVNEAFVAARENVFVLIDDDARPIAAAGFDEWGGIMAHAGALTAPEHRCLGAASTVTSIATSHALETGLIPQWHTDTGNAGSRKLAAAMGYQEVGTHTIVLLAG